MTDFEDIRPYNDDEVHEVIKRILADPEFISTVTSFKFPHLPGFLQRTLHPIVRLVLNRNLSNVKNVAQVQQACSPYLDQAIKKTTSEVTISGLDKLPPGKPYLFISNHRDIAMDPAFVNYALYHNNFDTARIAIGDNLLQKPFVSDLMRLNKSFIVKRSASGVREKMATYMDLSRYIHRSIDDGSTIWIAQREGRAKDGIDQTDPAIIKMLYMSQKKAGQSFSQYINWLKIVPVTISYEYNPCDQMIAKELYEVDQHGEYEKASGEDIKSIATGITGQKGHVNVAFGEILKDEYADADSVAEEIDCQMTANTLLFPSNYIAANQLGNTSPTAQKNISDAKEKEFLSRLAECESALKPYLLALYANVLLREIEA